MCLITKQEKPLIAEEDIVVYKAFAQGNRSPYQGFDYTPYIGKLFTDTADEECVEVTNFCDNFINLEVFGGFIHSYTNLAAIKSQKLKRYVRKCIIPKGTKYFVSEFGNQIASKSIIIGEEVLCVY